MIGEILSDFLPKQPIKEVWYYYYYNYYYYYTQRFVYLINY